VERRTGTGAEVTERALEKNSRAIRFYERNGFHLTDEKKPEEDTAEYLVKLKR